MPLGGARGVPLVAQGVSRRYGDQVALDDVSATFEPGKLTVVVGPSGSGKSTLLALITGMDVPDEGEVRLADTVVSSLDRARAPRFAANTSLSSARLRVFSASCGARRRARPGAPRRPGRSRQALAQSGHRGGWPCCWHADRRVERPVGRFSASASRSPGIRREDAIVVADQPTSRSRCVDDRRIGALFVELRTPPGTTGDLPSHDPLDGRPRRSRGAAARGCLAASARRRRDRERVSGVRGERAVLAGSRCTPQPRGHRVRQRQPRRRGRTRVGRGQDLERRDRGCSRALGLPGDRHGPAIRSAAACSGSGTSNGTVRR